jgi:fibronectin type 3 domain-containing protein
VLTPSSTVVSFGNVAVGSSTSELVTLTNTGNENATISSITVTGHGFGESGSERVTIAPEQAVTVSLSFNPGAAGTVQGSMSVNSNASLVQVSLTGTGFQPNLQHSVALSWQASASQVLGYFIYRGTQASNLAKLNASIDGQTTYTDTTVVGGQTYLYAVTSVGTNNIESAPSVPVSITIPAQ